MPGIPGACGQLFSKGLDPVPGFQAHITGSSILGAAYGAAGWYLGGLPPASAALGVGLCMAASTLPDLDSGEGIPLRESTAFAAALIPVLMIQRFQQWGVSLEGMILAAAAIYAVVRFGLAYLIENFSKHRGMMHSVPAGVIAGQLTFLAFVSAEPLHRYFIAGAVVLGFLSHLVLDEIWAVRQGLFGPKVKKSFGTALKFAGPELWPTIVGYALVLALGAVAAGDAHWTERVASIRQHMEHAARYQQPYHPAYPQQVQQPQQWQFRR